MKKLQVVLVDDEIMIREGFKRLFDWAAHDCEVVGEAADGMEALAQIDHLQPDIVIMDINIPIINGLKVIQTSRMRYQDMAFIIVSGYDDFSYCREALRMRITDYILKPVNYEEFGSCIDRLKIALYEKRKTEEQDAQEERTITGIIRYLQEHLDKEISLNILADEFHLSSQYISQLFKSEIGVNFLAYLTSIRMERAKKLLLATSFSIGEISEKCGYADYRVFTKAFKKEVHPLNTGEIFWRKNRRNEIAMDRNVIHKLLVVSRCELMAAGIIFLIISLVSGTGSKWMIISTLECILISNLFYIVGKGIVGK